RRTVALLQLAAGEVTRVPRVVIEHHQPRHLARGDRDMGARPARPPLPDQVRVSRGPMHAMGEAWMLAGRLACAVLLTARVPRRARAVAAVRAHLPAWEDQPAARGVVERGLE